VVRFVQPLVAKGMMLPTMDPVNEVICEDEEAIEVLIQP
jgi:hypothetical protein